MAVTIDPDPWGSYYFSLELDGTEVAHFTECSGLKTTSEVFEIQEGGLNGALHKRPGRSKWDNIVLKAATSASTQLLEWRDTYLQGDYSSRPQTSGAIIMRSNDGKELRRFTFVNAWPVNWEGPTLAAGSSDLAIETLEIAHEGIYVDAGPKPKPPKKPEPLPEKIETEPVQFEYDSSELTPEGEETVDDLAEQLNEHPEVEDVYIEGHTCNMGSWSYNKGLSQARANSVKARLEKEAPGKNYHASGYSFDHPVASNSTQAGREKNRRVEFFQSPRSGKRPGELA